MFVYVLETCQTWMPDMFLIIVGTLSCFVFCLLFYLSALSHLFYMCFRASGEAIRGTQRYFSMYFLLIFVRASGEAILGTQRGFSNTNEEKQYELDRQPSDEDRFNTNTVCSGGFV